MRTCSAIALVLLLTACSSSSDENGVPDSAQQEYRTPPDLSADNQQLPDIEADRGPEKDVDVVSTPETMADNGQTQDMAKLDLLQEQVSADIPSAQDVPEPDLDEPPEVNIQDVTFQDMQVEDLSQSEETATVEVAIDVPEEVPPEEQKNASIDLSSHIVRKAIFDDHLQVNCKTVDGYGDQVQDPGQYTIEVSALDAVEDELGFSFPGPGTYTATCTDQDNSLTASAQFVVSHEAVSPTVTSLSSSLGRQAGFIRQALDAAAADDQQGMDQAIQEMLSDAEETALLDAEVVISPPSGWPTPQQLAAQFQPEPDDDAYLGLVDQAAQEVSAFALALQTMKATPSQENAQAVLKHADNLTGLTQQMQELEPGVLALNQSMDIWTQTVQTLVQTQKDYADLLADMFANPDAYAPPSCPNCITLVGLVTTMAVGAILSYVPSYQKLLMEAGKAAASMAIMMAIADAIDAAFKPGPDAPEIQYVSPGYSNAVNDGAALSLFVSGFDYGPGNNAVIFIGPDIGDAAAGAIFIVIDGIKAVKGLKNWSNAWELANAMKSAFSGLKKIVKELGTTIPNIAEKGCVSLPVLNVEPFLDFDDFWEQTVNLGPLPQVNSGWLPKVGILVPMSFTRGVGETYKIVILP